jgi:N-acetylneuraminate synthase
VRFIETAVAHAVDKDTLAEDLSPMRELFTKSVVTRTELAVGTVLRAEHLTAKKPGTGIPATSLPDLIGGRLRRALEADEMIRPDDVEVVQ